MRSALQSFSFSNCNLFCRIVKIRINSLFFQSFDYYCPYPAMFIREHSLRLIFNEQIVRNGSCCAAPRAQHTHTSAQTRKHGQWYNHIHGTFFFFRLMHSKNILSHASIRAAACAQQQPDLLLFRSIDNGFWSCSGIFVAVLCIFNCHRIYLLFVRCQNHWWLCFIRWLVTTMNAMPLPLFHKTFQIFTPNNLQLFPVHKIIFDI